MDLSKVSTLELAQALAARTDLGSIVRSDGQLNPDIWPLRSKLGAVGCVDGVAVRIEQGEIVGSVIRRKTGKFPGKLALVGGIVALYESIEAAMRRHWGTDLGLEINLPLGWDHPVCMRQYAPQVDGKNRPDFCEDPGKHSIGITHLVTLASSSALRFGENPVGGQEAEGFLWYGWDCPAEEEWAYNMRGTFLEVLLKAKCMYKDGSLLPR